MTATTTKEHSIVTFWDRELAARCDGGTLSRGQAAKRDLDRYHRLLADALPAIPQRAAELLVAWHQDHRDELSEAPSIDSGFLWGHLVASLPKSNRDFPAVHPLNALHPVERAALIDACDRVIARLDASPHAHLPDLLPEHFRITPERS